MVLEAIQYDHGQDSAPSALRILDQLLLPHQSLYISIPSSEEAHAAIKQMRVRGAPAIAIVAALALAVETKRRVLDGKLPPSATEVKELLGERLDFLKTSRPTAVNLGDAVGKLKTVLQKAAGLGDATGKSVAEVYIRAAEQTLVDDVADNKAIGDHGAKWIVQNTIAGRRRGEGDGKQGLKILTHCNTGSLATAGYGTALGVIRSLHESGVLLHTFCSETRPYNQGSRLTAFELVHDGIPATLVTDSMAAALMSRQKDDLAAVVVGADRVAANGDTANKIGTYSLAVLAKYHNVKFLVAAPRTTIDMETASGKDIVVEERAPEEVTRIRGACVDTNGNRVDKQNSVTISIAAPGIDVWNPAFDITPASLIDGVVTECGVMEKIHGSFDFRSLFDKY